MNCESSKQFSNSLAQHGGSVLKKVVDLNVCVEFSEFSAAFACVFLPYSKIRQVKRNEAFELP